MHAHRNDWNVLGVRDKRGDKACLQLKCDLGWELDHSTLNPSIDLAVERYMALDFSTFEQYDALRKATKLLFHGEYEPVWIINSEEVQLKEIMQYYPDMPEPPKPPPPPPKPGPMLVRVPMCCPDCEERLEVHLKTLPGIEKLEVDWVENKVTVIGSEKDPINAVDLLSECRKLFKKSDKW